MLPRHIHHIGLCRGNLLTRVACEVGYLLLNLDLECLEVATPAPMNRGLKPTGSGATTGGCPYGTTPASSTPIGRSR